MVLEELIPILQTIYPLFYFIGIILATWLVVKILDSIVKRAFSILPHLVLTRIRKGISAFIWAVGILIAIEQLGLRAEILIAIIVLLGIAAIIALKDVLSNIASKYFSDIYVPYKVGDRISIAGYTGSVIEINPLVTVLLTDDGKTISIPNSFFVSNIVVNETREAWREIIIPILIEKGLDIAEVEAEILKRVNKLRSRLDDRFPPTIITRRADENNVEIILVARIKDPMDKDAITNEINRRVLEAIEYMKSRGRK
ncbi:MAG: mechanosensitive ion channel [Sulfolobales archaeon]